MGQKPIPKPFSTKIREENVPFVSTVFFGIKLCWAKNLFSIALIDVDSLKRTKRSVRVKRIFEPVRVQRLIKTK